MYTALNLSEKLAHINQTRVMTDHCDIALSQPIITFHIQKSEHIALEKIAHQILQEKKLGGRQHDLEFAEYTANKIKFVAPHFARTIEKLLADDAAPATLISGLPVIKNKKSRLYVGEIMSLCYALLLGKPFQYLQQNDSQLVARVSPRVGYENTNSGYSRAHFGWHTDDRIFLSDHRTQWIQLLGVINEGLAETLLAPIDDIVLRLPPGILNVLMQDRFEVKMPTSFGFRNNIWSNPVPLIWRNEKNQYEVGVATYHVRPIENKDDDAWRALAQFFSVIDHCQYGATLLPDTLFIFDNNRVLHGRTPIVGERMVLRTYIRRDLQSLRNATGNADSSVFDARFLI